MTTTRLRPLLISAAYVIHNNAVASNGSCASIDGVLDPYNVTAARVCDPADPKDCMVGDLSGKHGTINGTGFTNTCA